MKIAYIGAKGFPSRFGVDRVIEALISHLGAEHEITVYCSARYTQPGYSLPRVKMVLLPSLQGKHLHMLSIYLLAALHALFFGHYDLIHVHNVEAGFIVPLLRLRYKVIGTSHSRSYTAEKWGRAARFFMWCSEWVMLKSANGFTCVTPVLAEYYSQYRETVVVPNGVDPEQVCFDASAQALLDHYQITPPFLLFAAGRILPLKGLHLLLEAYTAIGCRIPLVVVGDLAHVPDYAQSLTQKKMDGVCYLPFISSKETLMGLVHAACLFVFPSLNEAMSVMLLEAATLGTPILCSDIPQNQYILAEAGCYFHSGDTQDLAEKLGWALEHPSQMLEKAKQSRAYVLEKYHWKTVIQRYNRIYQRVAGGV